MPRDNFWNEPGRTGHRTRRGDMVPIILNLLLEEPMHGYEIISRLEEKSHGMWRPSAGSVYPNLQLLEEQGLITSQNEDGKKVYSLTEEGNQSAQAVNQKFKNRWQSREAQAQAFRKLKTFFLDVMSIIKDIASQQDADKNKKVEEIMNRTKEELARLRDE